MRAVRGNKKLRFALIGVAVAVLVGVAWLVWPQRPKDLTLRLKFVRSEVVDGKTNFLFRVDGADKYQIVIKGFWYLSGDGHPLRDPPAFNNHVHREFYTASPIYLANNDEGWKLQAAVSVFVENKNFSRLYWGIKNTWRLHTANPKQSVFSLAKSFWQYGSMTELSGQTLTSELITNTPPH